MDRSRITLAPFEGADWQAALEGLAGPGAGGLQQSAQYGDLAARLGRRVARLDIRADGGRIGLVQMLGRRGLWLASRGPVFAPEVGDVARARALRRVARRSGVLLATPEAPVAGAGIVPLITARHHAVWSLAAAPDGLRAAMAGKWRNRLAAAERSDLRIRIETDPGWLLAAEIDQRRARGYRALPVAMVQSWGQIFPNDLLVLRAETATGERVAGAIFLRHGTGASYHIGWTGAEGRRLGAQPLLLWQGALMLRAQGVRALDLGPVDSDSGAGLLRFKLGTGAVPQRLGASCWVLPG